MMSKHTDSIRPYLADLEKLTRISSNEIESLIGIYQLTSSLSARNAIIEYFLPMVPQLLLRYARCGIDLDELLQIANIKLVEIIDLLPDTEVSSLRGFIITSINNAILNTIKHYESQGFILTESQ